MNHKQQIDGFSLIEVLIALFVLAVGILGIVGLQIFAKQNNHDAVQRTTAASLATDIVERMRLNKSVLASYISAVAPIAVDTTMPTKCNGSAQACTVEDIAAYDLAMWHAMVAGASDISKNGENVGGLVEPSACIRQDPNALGTATGQREYRIVIAWRGRSALGNPTVDTCGEDPSGERYGIDNRYRRIFVLDARIE